MSGEYPEDCTPSSGSAPSSGLFGRMESGNAFAAGVVVAAAKQKQLVRPQRIVIAEVAR